MLVLINKLAVYDSGTFLAGVAANELRCEFGVRVVRVMGGWPQGQVQVAGLGLEVEGMQHQLVHEEVAIGEYL